MTSGVIVGLPYLWVNEALVAVEVVVVVLVPVADADQADVETLPRPLDIGQRLVGQLESDLVNVFV